MKPHSTKQALASRSTPAITPVVLSGGAGTRLWPLSRSMYPKQFIGGLNGQQASLLNLTLTRLPVDEVFAQPRVICNNAHRFLVRDEAERSQVKLASVILEPTGRNTAPAIAVAALDAAKDDPETILVVMPSDHMIEDTGAFRAAVRAAASVAALGKIVLFGIKPTSPNTGYGYIQRGAALGDTPAFAVESFREKPDAITAEGYVSSGDFFWNSGIFVFRADAMIEELQKLRPDILAAARSALGSAESDLEFLRLGSAAFEAAPSISIDYAVLEATSRAAVLPLDIGWSDLGSWSSLWDTAKHDAAGNFARGEVVLEDTENCYIHSERALVATLGVKDLIVVETPDAVLVADKDRAQDVGTLVKSLAGQKRREQEQHIRNHRPWGYFETLSIGGRFQVKLLHVKRAGFSPCKCITIARSIGSWCKAPRR